MRRDERGRPALHCQGGGQQGDLPRIYYFRNAGKEEIYLGSADLMPRNLNRRVEVLFPVRDSKLIRHLHDEVLATYLADVAKARYMQSDGCYVRDKNRAVDEARNSQQWFIDRAVTGPLQ